MQHLSRRTVIWLASAVLAWGVAWSGGFAWSADTGRVDGASADVLWRQGVDLVGQGDFHGAAGVFQQLPPGKELTDKVRAWLEDYEVKQAARREADQADLKKYVEYAKQRIERKEYTKALNWALAAADCAVDREAFLQNDWLHGLVNDSLAAAEELRQKGEWREAWRHYWPLADLYDRDPRYQKLERDVITHLRLDIMFEEDKNWRERLEKVRWEDAERALEYIGGLYVEPADFKGMTESGLEQMLLLAESKSARQREEFEGLQNDNDRRDFVARVNEKLKQVRATSSLSWKETRRHFRRVVRDINAQTIRLPEELIVSELMRGALEPLDEFTTIIWPLESTEFDKHTRGDFVGVGISIIKNRAEEVEVVTPLEDTPAYRAGIMAGDIITEVDGLSIKGFSLNKCVDTITGPKGTSVTLTIRRDDENLKYPLKRAKVKIQSVKGVRRNENEQWNHWLDQGHGIGYIRVTNFQRNTVEDVENVLADLDAHGLRGLVLDLRSNPGGLLDSAWRMARLFLNRGENVVSTRGRDPAENQRLDVRRSGPYSDLPVAVLVDEASASASEIVAGAIRDNHHGTVVGARTFGKFSVQNLIPLSRRTNAKLKLTTARYYLPSGVSLHREPNSDKWGVEPDVPVRLVSKERMNVWRMRREAERLGPPKPEKPDEDIEAEDKEKAEDESPTAGAAEPKEEELPPLEQPDENNRPKVDPQLDAVLLLMRVKLLGEQYPTVAAASTEAVKESAQP